MKKLLTPYELGNLSLKNALVMAPMTRSRAIGYIPNELMATYYGQRSGAGLIISEGTAPSPNGLGYCRIPGLYSDEQVAGWKLTTDAVHEKGSKIFAQLMHTGRVSHIANMPEGSTVVGVSDIPAAGQMYTDTLGMQDFTPPAALTTEGVYGVIEEYVQAAKNAIAAGFDGVELHGANGYLLEQFLNPHVNNRTDEFGGSIKNRTKAILMIAEKVAQAIGKDKIGIKFSPYSTFNDMPGYPSEEVHQTYIHLAEQLNELGIAYLHIGISGPHVPPQIFEDIREAFKGTLIMNGGYTAESAEVALENYFANLIAFGRNYLANPDYEQRLYPNAPMNALNYDTFYTPFAEGYTDYPFLSE